MPDDPAVKKLEVRITELENQLKGFTAPPESLTAEEIQAFHKVSAHLGFAPGAVKAALAVRSWSRSTATITAASFGGLLG